MHIDLLPCEILEKIFRILDGQSLTRAEVVCSRWCCIIQALQRKAGFWRTRCIDEISTSVLEEILGCKSCHTFLDDQEDPGKVSDQESIMLEDQAGQEVSNERRHVLFMDDQPYSGEIPIEKVPINWKSVYKSWFRGKMIASWPYGKKQIRAFETNPVTCVRVSGAWVVTGHRNGIVQAWNRFNNHHRELVQHLKIITDFVLMDVFCIGPYLPLYSDEHTWDHHLIVSISKDQVIQVNPTLDDSGDGILAIQFHSNCLESVSAFNNRFAVRCLDNTITLWNITYERKYDPASLSAFLIQSVIGGADGIQWIGFWDTEVRCLSGKGTFSVYCSKDRAWVSPPSPLVVPGDISNPQKRILGIKKAFLFRQTVVIIITEDGKLWISIDGKDFTSYYTMMCIRTTVVSIALRGKVLVLGTENGRLLVYHVPRTEDLMTLNLENPSWSSTLSEAPIIAVDVTDCDPSAVIAASTSESVFLITWYPPRSRQRLWSKYGIA